MLFVNTETLRVTRYLHRIKCNHTRATLDFFVINIAFPYFSTPWTGFRLVDVFATAEDRIQ